MLRQTVAEEEALCKDGNKENKVKKSVQAVGVVTSFLFFLVLDVVLLLVSSPLNFMSYFLIFFPEHANFFSVRSDLYAGF